MSRRAKSSLWILPEWSVLMCDDYCRSRPAGWVQMEAGIAEEHQVLHTVEAVPASISVPQLVLGTESVFHGRCSLISDQTFSVAVILPGLWSVSFSFSCSTSIGSLAIPCSFQLFCACSSKKNMVGYSSHPTSLRQTLLLDVISVHLKLRMFHQEISRLPDRLESLLNATLKTFWSLDWVWEVWKSPYSWSWKDSQIVSSSLNSLM